MTDCICGIFDFDRDAIDFDGSALKLIDAHDRSGRFRPAAVYKAGNT